MRYILFLSLFICSFYCKSQIREKGNIELTPIVGYSASAQSLFSNTVTGIQLGVYGNYYLNDRWSIRSGLLYQKMGTNNLDFLFFSKEYSEGTTYLSIPFTFSFHFGKKRNWYINYGTGIGILTMAEADYDDGNGTVNIYDSANPIQLGINGGIGYKLRISPDLIVVIENASFIGLTNSTKVRTGKNLYTSFNLGAIIKL